MDPYRPDDPAAQVPCDICGELVAHAAVQFTTGGARACAGTIGRTAIFALPGSEHAVRLALGKLILPEIGHVVRELQR